MSLRLRILVVGFVLLLAVPLVSAEVIDDEPEAVALYAKGKRLMRQGDWLEASKTFEELAGRFESSRNLDLFVFNRAKAQYYFGEYDKAIAGFAYFIRKFPNSDQLAYAMFFRGNASYLKGDVNTAIHDYIAALQNSVDPRLDNLTITSIVTIFKNATAIEFGPSEFAEIPHDKLCRLVPKLSKIHEGRGETEKAQRLLELCGLKVDHSTSGSEKPRSHSELEIAMLLPFSGELKPFADEIYNGGVIAAEMFREKSRKELLLSPYDTKGDAIDAARIVSDLAESFTVNAVVGPLTSEEAAVTSASLSCSDLPMVVPAATQAGLTRLSSSSFQLSPNIELQGIRMAEYALTQLGADSAAVITPTSTDELRMARAFTRRFEQLGGTVVAIEYYRPRDNDFGKQVRDIKGILLGYAPDSIYIINDLGDTLDFDEQPARLDCVFLPGEPSTLRLLIPQINFYNLDSKLLGSDGWGGEAILKLGDDITHDAVFPSPFITLGTTEEYFDFASRYDQRYSTQPTRLATLGFDAVRLIGKAIAEGKNSRKDITAWLKGISGYDGASGKISFGADRENIDMPLYRIHAGEAVRLDSTQTETSAVGADDN